MASLPPQKHPAKQSSPNQNQFTRDEELDQVRPTKAGEHSADCCVKRSNIRDNYPITSYCGMRHQA